MIIADIIFMAVTMINYTADRINSTAFFITRVGASSSFDG
jgi:hypothetical protein